MTARARISAVVIVRNGERYLRQALASITAQTWPVHEMIVVDGGSTDGTLAIAHDFAVQVVTQRGTGIADARNVGIAHAQGEYIAFLDHDDLWHPEKLARQMALHDRMPGIAYSLTQMILFRDDDTPFLPQLAAAEGEAPRIAGTPSVLVAKRLLFEQMGGFNERFSIACDAEWFTRARDARLPSAVVPEVLTYKRLHERNASRNIALNRQEMFAVARESIGRQQEGRGADSSRH